MLNHVILWAYSSIWKAPVTGLRQPLEALDVLYSNPEEVIVEREAFDRVMRKARVGVSPSVWSRAQGGGWC
jgi:hypothetical protein